ncbi:hypothetical protein [Algoriphagus aquimarinus]|mgnify:CR=1 FL=1|uniref:hypothetical protein n=1 Tax=Algoriphagus aquimarinus TaxID=237018 RepID=UPI0030D8B698|tara:strand:+ start:24665 stop:24940 length:276 start_codon:yes stop_codon:yes gene_type:complete
MNDEPNKLTETEEDVVAKVIIHMPTEPEISFECPLMFKLPEEGRILDIAYEKFITDQRQWERAQSTLDNDVMVIDRIEGFHVYLREGNPVD